MTPEEAGEEARQINKILDGNTEARHWELDELLLAVLTELGYTTLVEEFEKSERWYA